MIGFTLQLARVPAPPPLVDAVQEIVVDVSTELAGAFRITFGISQTPIGDWSILQLDPFRPLLPVTVSVTTGLPVPAALINGFVAGQQVRYGKGGGTSTLEVSGLDATGLMNLVEKVMPWPSMPDAAIASAIFGQYAVVPVTQPTPPVLVEPQGTTIQRGTDIRFLRRLARRNGFDCYVQPQPVTGLDAGYFRPPQVVGLPQAVLNVDMGSQTNFHDVSVDYEMLRPTTAMAASLDVATKAPQPAVAPVPTSVPMGVEPALARVLPPPVARPAGLGVFEAAGLQSAVQAVVDRAAWAVTVSGTAGADVGVVRPGGPVTLRGAGRVFNGSYYVTRVVHTITKDRYEQRITAHRNAVGMTGAEVTVLP